MKSIYNWLEGYNYSIINNNSINYFTAELKKEVTENHLLFGKKLIPIAKDNASDDVIFKDGNSYYIVHLTYNKPEELGFPNYKYFKQIEELKQYFLNKYSMNIN